MDTTGQSEILGMLREKFRIDTSGYRPAFLSRRLDKRLAETACGDYSEYIQLLRSDGGAELKELLHSLSVPVSMFFRDPLLFDLLAEQVLPDIVECNRQGQQSRLRIWSAACAAGQESASLAILVAELRHPQIEQIYTTLFGTDIDATLIARAREGRYTARDLEHVTLGRLRRWFVEREGLYVLHPEIRQRVRYVRHDLLDERQHLPPDVLFSQFDMLACRNLLMYYGASAQETIFNKLDAALKAGGYLLLGRSEYTPEAFRANYSLVLPRTGLYRKRSHRV
ncbi:MAG: protein-glutamate O-methyltransferase CheR [Bacteroidetes bacterium]|nr:protein-glutamate O-methyltransferase CheR [Bacteroidota bacterium]